MKMGNLRVPRFFDCSRGFDSGQDSVQCRPFIDLFRSIAPSGVSAGRFFEEFDMSLPNCPKCGSEYTYEDNGMFVCPECAHEWNDATPAEDTGDQLIVKDANGTLLADGDSVTIIKSLKVKGASSMLKIGTKVKNIRLCEGDHNIDCKIDGFGAMKLKSEFVKKL